MTDRHARLALCGLFAAATLCIVPLGADDQAGLDKVDAFVGAEMARQKVPGIAMAIVKKGSVVVVPGCQTGSSQEPGGPLGDFAGSFLAAGAPAQEGPANWRHRT